LLKLISSPKSILFQLVSVIDLRSPKIAFLSNIATLVLKILASILTSSSAVFIEFLRSVGDLTNSGLVYVGNRIALRGGDDHFHPFGKTMYLYVFGFAVAVLALSSITFIGFLESINAILNPSRIENTWIGIAIILVSMAIDLSVMISAARDNAMFTSRKGFRNPLLTYIVTENIYDIAGECIAISSLIFSNIFPLTDGVASLMLNIILVMYLIKMVTENIEVLVYRSAPPYSIARAVKIALSNPAVRDVNAVKTFALEPKKYTIFMDIELDPKLSMEEVDEVIEDIKSNIIKHVNEFVYVHVEPRKPDKDVDTHKKILKLLSRIRTEY